MWHLLFSSASLAEAAGSFGFKHTNVSWRLQSTLWYLPMVPRAHVLLAAGETNVIFGSEFSFEHDLLVLQVISETFF